MSQLFKKRKLEKRAKDFLIPDLENKIEEIEKWYRSYEDGSLKQKNEGQCEQTFNQSFFEKILGYTPFPSEEYTIEPKGDTQASGQKPDAVLAHFKSNEEIPNRVGAVVEIKDANVALDRPQKRANSETPVQQGFRYKGQYSKCDFVIVTNFYEIRLLKDNQLDFQTWTLESLVDPQDDYLNFRTFYFLLCAENLLSKRGESKTQSLLSEIRIDQEKITKSFYSEYKELRTSLIKNIFENNKEARSRANFYEIAVEKSQKIIDRLVFVAFCEDIDLLPENTLHRVIKHAQNSFSGVWDTMKGFFNAVDSGSEKLGIPEGYNGELFKPDSVLDGLKIDDEICEKFLEIGKYDFSEDVSVNILGHIFEQSISDLEELKAVGTEDEVDKKKSKRKKDGIFYTPEYIVDYIVRNSVGTYLAEKEEEILNRHGVKEGITDKNYEKRLKEAYIEYQKVLHDIKVLDPACGSGAFLVNVFDFLLAENKRVGEIIGDLFSQESYFRNILQNNIYGVDLNPESVEISKLSLWLKTAQKGKKLASLDKNIKCGNSLIDDPEVAGDRAFRWEEEFKDIMSNGGFDVVVGNPPYVVLAPNELGKFSNSNTQGNNNTYVAFTQLAEQLLKKRGVCSFIIPNTWFSGDNFLKFRNWLLCYKFLVLIQLPYDIFEAYIDTVVLAFQKEVDENKVKCFKYGIKDKNSQLTDDEFDEFSKEDWRRFGKIFIDKSVLLLGDKIWFNPKNVSLGSVSEINRGSLPPREEEKSEENNFTDGVEWFDGQVFRYTNTNMEYPYVSYSKLRENKPLELFKTKKILARQLMSRQFRMNLTYSEKSFAFKKNLYAIYNLQEDQFSYKYILGVLNSRLFSWSQVNFNTSLQRDDFPAFSLRDFKNFLIPNTNKENQEIIEIKVENMLTLTKNFSIFNKKFLKLIQYEYQIEKVPKKLEKYWELDFDDFVKQIKAKDLPLSEKSELLDFFEKNKKGALELKSQIDATDSEIDEMVFELYGLTEEERELVLKG